MQGNTAQRIYATMRRDTLTQTPIYEIMNTNTTLTERKSLLSSNFISAQGKCVHTNEKKI